MCDLLQETEHMVPASMYYNEYMYAPVSNQMVYDGAAAAVPENVQVENSVAWYECNRHFRDSRKSRTHRNHKSHVCHLAQII